MLTARPDSDTSTRQRVLRLVVEDGPVSVVDLARDLDLTTAGVRRHVAALEETAQIAVFESRQAPAGRGRPARRYVATELGKTALSSAYADLATLVLDHLRSVAGDDGVHELAVRRAGELAARHAGRVAAAGPDVDARAVALAEGMAEEGYAASVRPVPGTSAVQLCQGHCPVQSVAAQFPELCEAETRMFSEVLGVHVQRLSTIAAGGHACTTHVPIGPPPRRASTVHDPSTSRRPATGATGAMEGTR